MTVVTAAGVNDVHRRAGMAGTVGALNQVEPQPRGAQHPDQKQQESSDTVYHGATQRERENSSPSLVVSRKLLQGLRTSPWTKVRAAVGRLEPGV